MMLSFSKRRGRGFTLIELVAGLSIALVVVGVTFDVYLLLRSQSLKTRASAEVKRNARNVLSTLSRFLKMAGSGMPGAESTNGDPNAYPNGNIPYNGSTSPPENIGPAIIRARQDGLVFLGDFPRPDSNLNGLSVPAHAEGYQRYAYGTTRGCPRAIASQLEATGTPDATNHITLLNELSGGCLAGSGCNTATASILLPNVGEGCDSGHLTVPTCPWSLKKYRPSEYILLVYPSHRWLQRQVNHPAFTTCCEGDNVTIHTHCTGAGEYEGLSLFYEAWGGNGTTSGGRNIPNTMGAGWVTEGKPVSTLVFPANRGWAATIERIFFRYNSTAHSIQFQMCWGPLGRGHARWNDIDAAAPCDLGATGSGLGGTAAMGGTGWQTIATNVESMHFDYYDTDDVKLTSPPDANETLLASVSRVEVTLTMSRLVGSQTLTSTEVTSIQLRSRKF